MKYMRTGRPGKYLSKSAKKSLRKNAKNNLKIGSRGKCLTGGCKKNV
jgi:hypothetical protein